MSASETPTIAESSKASGKAKEEPIEDDDLYCLQSTFVFFLVEKRMFHIPSYRFADESHVFAGMFKLPQASGGGTEGLSRENPIVLPADIRHKDFRNFLKALYPLEASTRLELSKDEWISVIRLATFWYFLKYRQMAISELQNRKKLSSSDKIVYGKEFKIRSWVEEGCEELVQRNESINKDEAVTIDYEWCFALFRLREQRLLGNLTHSVASEVQKTFDDELDIIKHFENEYAIDEVDIGFQEPNPQEDVASSVIAETSWPINIPEESSSYAIDGVDIGFQEPYPQEDVATSVIAEPSWAIDIPEESPSYTGFFASSTTGKKKKKKF